MVDDARTHSLDERLRGLSRALLVMRSPIDDTVAIDNAQRIFTAALLPKSLISLAGAGHLPSDDADSRYAGALIATWATRFLQSR